MSNVKPVLSISILVGMSLLGCNETQHARQAKWSTRDESVISPSDMELQPRTLAQLPVLNDSIRVSATDLLMQASTSTNPLLRANAIEGLQPSNARLEEVVRQGLADENEGVRFVATMTVGMKDICSLSHLVRPMLKDPSTSVQAAAIFSLDRCGEEIDLTPLGFMVMGSDPTAKANAAFILGELGNPSAIPVIRNGVGRWMGQVDSARVQTIDLVMAEAMVKLGDESEREVIRAALFSTSDRSELTALSCQMLGRLEDATMAQNLQELAGATGPREPGAEIQLLASEALARIDPARVPVEIVILQVSHERPEIRAQAATVLGTLDSARFGPQLALLLKDEDPRVQVAAAAAILRMSSSPVVKQEDGLY